MRQLRTFTLVAAAMLAFAGWAAAQAAATTTIGSAHKFKYVQDTVSVMGAGAPFSDAADCGAGFVAFSGGTVQTGQPAELRMSGSFTNGTHQMWRSTGFNTGFGKNVATVALCRKASPNIWYVKNERTLPASPSVVGAQAFCPGDKVIASGGVSVQGPLSQVHVSASHPVAATDAWKATVVNDSGAARPFTVYAECMPPGSGLAVYQTPLSRDPSSTGFSLDFPCPTSASFPLSGGAKWSGDQSQVHLASSGPIDAAGGVSSIPDVAWRIGANNDAGATKTMTGYLICAPA